jgi:cell fate regulator YaaT (PSP1 superfamily)
LKIPHLVKFGLFGQIDRFDSVDSQRFCRYDEVVCRTSRGLETGEVLCALGDCGDFSQNGTRCQAAGELLRRLTPDDRMIVRRIEQFKDRAFNACQQLIRQQGIEATLIDVEHLFDGQSLYFYFLGDVPPEAIDLTDQLAETYEKKVRFKNFTETLAKGCGPNCGTESSVCGTNHCVSCAARGHCRQ